MLKISSFSLLLVFLSTSVFAQDKSQKSYHRKNSFFVYWGWNRAAYTKSDIHFTGDNYDFTLNKVIAYDRQSRFNANTYFNPAKMTIPQYNFRFGYYLNDHYSLSFGADHMKYVMENWLTGQIDGTISNTGTKYDGVYDNQSIVLAPDLVMFEHTDGLNYENIELRRWDELFAWKFLKVNINEGLGIGVLVPRTNCTLLTNKRYDEFHLAGFGTGAVVGLNLEFWHYFFIQSEFKGGFIAMPDIRTTEFKSDRASQHFFFAQYNCVFGANFHIKTKENKALKPE